MVSLQELEQTLDVVFGLARFRPEQLEVIRRLLAGRSAIAVFPTGSGKSLCYQLPALHMPGLTVVVSPLISLMRDQTESCRARGIPAARIDSTVDRREAARTLDAARRGEVKLLYTSPERCTSDAFVAAVAAIGVSVVAVDEAHTMSLWGTNFRPDLLRLPEFVARTGCRRVLALTATATPEVIEDIGASFSIPAEDRIVTSVYRENLRIEVRSTAPWDRLDTLARIEFDGLAIVYATHQGSTSDIARALRERGLDARAYHAGLPLAIREDVQTWFKASDRGVVVATEAFGMGIDVPNVRHVVHYNLPRSLEAYSQEIGRAGRDAHPASCTMLGSLDDVPALANFAHAATPPRAALDRAVRILADHRRPDLFDLAEIAEAADIDEPVLRTLVWHLEREGTLSAPPEPGRIRSVRLVEDPARIAARFSGERREFVERVLAACGTDVAARPIDVARMAQALGERPGRIEAAIEYLASRHLIEVRTEAATGDRDPGSVLERVTSDLVALFTGFERRALDRIDDVRRLFTHDGCLMQRLVAHFGDSLAQACARCTWCVRGRRSGLVSRGSEPRLPPRGPFDGFRATVAPLLDDPRSATRFLFGFGSPAFAAAGLTEHPAFGLLRRRNFLPVLDWLSRPPDVPAEPAERFNTYAAQCRRNALAARDRAIARRSRRARPAAARPDAKTGAEC